MKLLSILLFGSLFVQSLLSGVYSISKFGSYYSYANDNIFKLDLSTYKDIDYLYFKATVYYGYFGSGYLKYYYSSSSTAPSSLPYSSYYDSSSYGSYYTSYYNKYSYYWLVSKPSTSYFYVNHPYYYCSSLYTSLCYVYFENLSGFGLSLGAIIGIAIAAIVIIAVSIIVTYFVRRARRASYISPPVAVYTPPVAPAYPPPTYY